MAVRIRLTRMGRKKKPFYRIIVANNESPRDGKFLDIIGTYDPMQEPVVVKLDTEKLNDWLGKGAEPTVTVRSLMKDLISFIVVKLVDQPDAVEVTERDEGDTIIIELRVAKEDLGKVIGKQGRTAKAMRSLLSAAAGKLEKRSRLEILE